VHHRILTANSLRDLADRAHSLPALERPATAVLAELDLPPGLRQKALATVPAGLVLRRFLERKDLHLLIERGEPAAALLQALKGHLIACLPEDEATAITHAIERLGIPDVATWPAAVFDERDLHRLSLGETLRWSRQYAGVIPLGSLAHGVGEFAARVASARAKDAAHPLADSLGTVGDAELDALRRAVATLRTGPLASWPLGLFELSGRVGHDDQGLELAVRLAPRTDPALVRWRNPAAWRNGLELTCTRCRGPCVHRALFLEHLLAKTEKLDASLSVTVRQLVAPPWQRALELMEAGHEAEPKRELLSFVVDGDTDLLEVFVHAVGKKGVGKGRRVYRDQAYEHAQALDPADRRIAELLRLDVRDDLAESPELGDAMLLLVEHPRVHLELGGPPVPVRVRTAGLSVELGEGTVELKPEGGGNIGGEWLKSSRGPLRVVVEDGGVSLVLMPASLKRVADAVSRFGGTFPREALPRLAALLPQYEAATNVELPAALRGQEVPAQNRLVLRLDTTEGVALQLGVEPLPGSAVFVPGEGVPVAATFDGTHRRFAQRTLEVEVAEASALAAELGLGAARESFTWRLDASDESVELLRRVATLGERVTVEWTGVRARFRPEVGLEKLKLKVSARGGRDWFGVEGHLELDGARLTLAQLLEAARQRRRWVRLSDTDYAAVSQELVERLAPLAHLAGKEPTPTLTLGTVPLVDELAPHVAELDAAKGYRDLVARLTESRDRTYRVPKALKATLRDYQKEGFEWLCRLAEWGAGAVLADDMGLGKTLQALALLVRRAGDGPALVVAPSSVLHTWQLEAKRFAPSLRLHLFHESDRELEKLGAGDVVVVSWALLTREAARFQARRFTTVVLDEVQAIKNAGTQRAQAAHGLEADFVVGLSGTPVENHVGELWSLFRATVPSLLGSEESFQQRFGSGQGPSLAALAKVVRPFILRRTKDKVAKELPSRTEVDVLVTLSDAERELYEDVRLAAVKALGDSVGSDKRFEVLAALTRLRLAAGHPKLVDAQWKGPTSKLSRLLELVRGLSEGSHRALVFSQFTTHLALVAEALRTEGIVFSYLDGQVPTAERARRVAAFQAGQGGDVFLISLKAGGTGLTLTAASYVLHLDPWWNPAVEDQASDRAHRVGQSKPVTIYRLIAEGTIEQRILSLHSEKRELVDALLEGTEKVGKLSMTQLAALVRGQGGD
jgi:superfamily II DNA or RNA helicase